MTTFLDVAAVRVQRYLGRWPQLAGRRAAAAMLSGEISGSSSNVTATIAGRAALNDEAGDIDSVLSLVMLDGHDPQELARDLLSLLRRVLPAAELEAGWATADDYVSCYSELRSMIEEGRGEVSIPLGCGFPALMPCDFCRLDPSSTVVSWHGDSKLVCPDCERRVEWSQRQHSKSPAEKRLADQIGKEIATDFAALAALGGGTNQNHLAHVMVDGNGFGYFFKQLVTENIPKTAISRALQGATWQALTTATVAVSGDSEVAHVLPHLVGGDDVLVSVCADDGWQFLTAYLDAFNSSIANVMQDLPQTIAAPTASASMIFAKSGEPIHSVIEQNEMLLRRAKIAGKGRTSTIAWLELTRRGYQTDNAFAPIELSVLHEWTPALAALSSRISTSALHTLEEQLAVDDVIRRDSDVSDTLRRLGLTAEVLQPKGVPSWDAQRALDIARWWK